MVYIKKQKELTTGREIKSVEEIEKIKKAQNITDKAFAEILPFIKIGLREIEIAAKLKDIVLSLGADGMAFDLIAASGRNGRRPHAVPTKRKLQQGDLLTLDFGAKLDGFHSDMTRTVALGKISPKQQHIYDTVLKAQLAALAMMKNGVLCKDADKTARDIIENAGYKKRFRHGLGHGIGLEIHEAPRLSPRSDPNLKLETGMVVSVEPGIYLKWNCGVRIEDIVVIRDAGIENLTQTTKELIVIE